MKNSNNRSRTAGEGIVIVIILLALIGGAMWWLVAHKKSMDQDARAFGHDVINRMAINHDRAAFSNNLSPEAKVQFPPSDQDMLMSQLTQLGTPAQPIKFEESVTWTSHFFDPKAYFTAHLNYGAGPGTLEIDINQNPAGKWQIINYVFTPPKQL